jgi:hypothetical protein
MGKGKGSFEYWACRVPVGRVVFEVGGGGIREEIARQGELLFRYDKWSGRDRKWKSRKRDSGDEGEMDYYWSLSLYLIRAIADIQLSAWLK